MMVVMKSTVSDVIHSTEARAESYFGLFLKLREVRVTAVSRIIIGTDPVGLLTDKESSAGQTVQEQDRSQLALCELTDPIFDLMRICCPSQGPQTGSLSPATELHTVSKFLTHQKLAFDSDKCQPPQLVLGRLLGQC